MYVWKIFVQVFNHVEIIVVRQVWMKPPDDMKLRKGFAIVLMSVFHDLIKRHCIRTLVSVVFAKSAEPAFIDADIGMVDMPVVDIKSGISVYLLPHNIGHCAEPQKIVTFFENHPVFEPEPVARLYFLRKRTKIFVCYFFVKPIHR